MPDDSTIYDLNEELGKLKLQIAIIQKTITLLGGVFEDNYCACGNVCNLCDENMYKHLDHNLGMILRVKRSAV